MSCPGPARGGGMVHSVLVLPEGRAGGRVHPVMVVVWGWDRVHPVLVIPKVREGGEYPDYVTPTLTLP